MAMTAEIVCEQQDERDALRAERDRLVWAVIAAHAECLERGTRAALDDDVDTTIGFGCAASLLREAVGGEAE